MPVVVLLPAVAGFAAGSMVTAGMLGMSLAMTSIVVGAVAGAVVGGIGAAITGGDIMEGVLFGAVGGAVGGYLGGSFTAGEFLGFGSNAGTGLTGPTGNFVQQGAIGGATPGATPGFATPVVKPAAAAASSGLGDMSTYALISGGAEMLKGSPEAAYASTKEGVTQATTSQEKIYSEKAAADLEAARIAAAQREKESQLAYKSNQEGLAFKQTELEKTLAQREQERVTPLQEAAAARSRATESATGLTFARRQKEADEINNYLAS